jgi:hypothetical protein
MMQSGCNLPIESMIESQSGGPRYTVLDVPGAAQLNTAILSQYRAACAQDDLQRTHFFAGRYENIYVPLQRVPALEPLLRTAQQGAARFLRREDMQLAAGFWFNEMGPGHVTLPHHHEEDDELVSGVYYVQVPPDSGDLVLGEGVGRRVLQPHAGRLVFFSPTVVHEVTRNNSRETRLSIGMNFGPARTGTSS